MEAFRYGCIVGGEWKFVSPFFREWVRRLK